mmetsp:Transcript_684/g.1616  ORF Transcript_684/g.1616 Transcript_684/m.1616 type:complete len:103 (+) Transcript_684:572-880(+)
MESFGWPFARSCPDCFGSHAFLLGLSELVIPNQSFSILSCRATTSVPQSERGVYEAQDVNGKSAEGILNVVKELAEQAAVVNARLSTKYGTNGDLRIPEVVQ